MIKVTNKRINEWKAFDTMEEAIIGLKFMIWVANKYDRGANDKRYTQRDFMIEYLEGGQEK